MTQFYLESDSIVLGNRTIIVFLAMEHLLGVRSDVEVHYQLSDTGVFGIYVHIFSSLFSRKVYIFFYLSENVCNSQESM